MATHIEEAEEIKEAARKIKEYCNKTSCSSDCIFYDRRVECIIALGKYSKAPCDWKID